MSDDVPKPMLAQLVGELPGENHIFEPKWDGFRCLAVRDGEAVQLHSRHGRPLGRYFPELLAALSRLHPERWTLDGEILVTVDGRFDFQALMQRLHPAASRVRELASRTPAAFVAFDLVAAGPRDLRDEPFATRRRRLTELLDGVDAPIFLTPATEDPRVARSWLEQFSGGGLDGVVAKHRDLRYTPGARAMLKVKRQRTLDCVVAGFRGTSDPPEVWSLMLGLYGAGDALEHIGVVSSFTKRRRVEFATEMAPLATGLAGHPWEQGFLAAGGALGRLKGAAGRWVPGMTMDWTPLAPDHVCEVSYTQVDGHRLRHPAKFVRWRPDREPRSCRLDQLDVTSLAAGQVFAGS